MDILSDPLCTAVAVLLPLTLAAYYFVSSGPSTTPPKNDTSTTIPWAPGQIPLLGHALSYRKNPSQFLLETSQQVGPIFQLNLAGKIMIIVAGQDAQRQVAKAPERLLSARQAVADLGFEETLGRLNVLQGTDLHKGIIKGIWKDNPTATFVQWKKAVGDALRVQVESSSGRPVEFLEFVRRVMLRVVIDEMIGSDFLSNSNFLDDFMNFQDELEEVTAKAVVLPRWIALRLLLRPMRRKREQLQVTIVQRLQELSNAGDDSIVGFWLQEMLPDHSLHDIAEYIVGLLFAAHKNPAIGAAQSYLMLWEHCSKGDQQAIVEDAKTLLSCSTTSSNEKEQLWNQPDTSLRRLCLETLRLTAHSIGGVRTVQEDFSLQVSNTTYVLPKGASVGLTHITPSLNPQLWGAQQDASKFSLRGHPMESYQDDYCFTTFSHGVHKCPGQQLALVLLQCTVAFLLLEYDVTLPTKIPPLSFERATLAQRQGPVMVSIRRKQNATATTK